MRAYVIGFFFVSVGLFSRGGLAADSILIRAQHVILGTGETLEPGCVLVRDGKIVAVGATLDSPEAKVIETNWVMPGMIHAAAGLGISGGESEISSEVTPDFDTATAVDLRDRAFREALNDGITTTHIIPGTQSVFSGFSCVLKTAGAGPDGDQPYVVQPQLGLVIAMCSDPTLRNQARNRPDTIFMRQPTNRMGVLWILRNHLHRAKSDVLAPDMTQETQHILKRALDGSLPVFSVSRKEVDIQSCFQLQDEFGIQPIIVGGDEAYRILDDIKAHKPTIVFTELTTGTDTRSLRGTEGTQRRWNIAGQLADAEVSFCLAGDSLLDQLRFAHRFGLDRGIAIESVTRRPASLLRQSDRIGSLEPNKDADMVAFDGDPLEFTSSIQWIMVDGILRKPL